jgi:hypothetical protein
MPYDPLDGIEGRRPAEQIAMLAVELRNQRNALAGLQHDLKWLLRGVWALVGPVFVGLIVYLVTHGPH